MKKYILTLITTMCLSIPAYGVDMVSYSVATTAQSQVRDLSSKLDTQTSQIKALIEKLNKQVSSLEQQNKSLEERVLALEAKQPKPMKKK